MLEALLKIFVAVERKENGWDIPTQLSPDNIIIIQTTIHFLSKTKKTSRIPSFSLLLISFQPSSIREPWLSKCNQYIADPQSPHPTKCCASINYNIKLGMEWCDDDTWVASLRLVTRE
jgi:hypothetical protein